MRFNIALAALTGTSFLTHQLAASRLWWPQPSWFLESLLFTAFSTALVYHYLLAFLKRQPGKFILLYLLSITVKVLAAVAYLVTLLVLEPGGRPANAVAFLILYVLFTLLEVIFLWRPSQNAQP